MRRTDRMAFSRRRFLYGIGGAALGIPVLEGLAAKGARAEETAVPPFALFYRRANGVQQAMFNQTQNKEPERWWPSLVTLTGSNQYDDAHLGRNVPMTESSMTSAFGSAPADCALRALAGAMLGGSASDYTSRLTVIRNLRHVVEGTNAGHREGFIQGLTGSGVKYPNMNYVCNATTNVCRWNTPKVDTFNCDPVGESLDNRIARELTGNDASLYFGLGSHGLGFVSWRRTNAADPNSTVTSRVGEENILAMYRRLFLSLGPNDDEVAQQLLAKDRKSVNDLVREQLVALRSDARLSKADRDRLQSHTDAIRDTEIAIASCTLSVTEAQAEAYQSGYSGDGSWTKSSTMVPFADIVARLSALAIACGVSRSVLVSMGEPQDVGYYTAVSGDNAGGLNAATTDFHSITHRLVNDNPDQVIANAQLLHHYVDVFHLNVFKKILDQLSMYTYGDGTTLLDKGVAVHYADLGSGQHETWQLPYLYVGSAGGKLVTDRYFNANAGHVPQLLNTIGAAVGCKNSAGTGPLDDFNANSSGISGRFNGLVMP